MMRARARWEGAVHTYCVYVKYDQGEVQTSVFMSNVAGAMFFWSLKDNGGPPTKTLSLLER